MLIQGTCVNIRRLGQCRMIGIEGTEDVSIERGSVWLGGAHAQASHRVSTQDAGNCRGTRCCTNPYNMGAENMGIPNLLICKYWIPMLSCSVNRYKWESLCLVCDLTGLTTHRLKVRRTRQTQDPHKPNPFNLKPQRTFQPLLGSKWLVILAQEYTGT